jgi:hypothetical protein
VVEVTPSRVADIDVSLHELRRLLGGPMDDRVDLLEHRVDDIDRQISDDDLLVARLVPIFDLLMRRMVREHRDVLVESLYPVIGSLINRAVREAIANLARRIDEQARQATDVRRIGWRLRAMVGGADASEVALRERLPFAVEEVLLIHRESGLLVAHEAIDEENAADRDLLAGMLTAIRAVAEEAFAAEAPSEGRGLDEVQVGERRLLLEADRHVVLAVVVDGIEPADYRERMRNALIRVRGSHGSLLERFEGDVDAFDDTKPLLAPLFVRGLDDSQEPERGGRGAALALAGVAVLLAALACSSFWAVRWTVSALAPAPRATATAVSSPETVARPTGTALVAPRETSAPTLPAAANRRPASRPAESPSGVAPRGNVWLRARPTSDENSKIGVVERGTPLQLLARSSTVSSTAPDAMWLWVALPERDDGHAEGWVWRELVEVESAQVLALPIANEAQMGGQGDDE